MQRGVDEANSRLSRVEQVKKFTIVPGDWMPGGAELTPTMKLKRKPIAEKYGEAIEAMYRGSACGRAEGSAGKVAAGQSSDGAQLAAINAPRIAIASITSKEKATNIGTPCTAASNSA